MLINVGKVFEEEEVEAGLRLSGESFEDLQRKQQGNYNQENVFESIQQLVLVQNQFLLQLK